MFWRKFKAKPKRKFERIRQTLRLPMPWLTLKTAQGQVVDGEILDISEGGLCLRLAAPLGEKNVLVLAFRDKDISAVVKWCRFVKDENAYQCGLELLDSDAHLLEEIMKVWSIGD